MGAGRPKFRICDTMLPAEESPRAQPSPLNSPDGQPPIIRSIRPPPIGHLPFIPCLIPPRRSRNTRRLPTILPPLTLEEALETTKITAERSGETSARIRERVVAARRRQQERFARKRNVACNARMGTRELKAFCALDEATLELLKMAMNELKQASVSKHLSPICLSKMYSCQWRQNEAAESAQHFDS